MPIKEHNSQNAFVGETDYNSSASNAIQIPEVSLPKGGGSIKGIDEKFEVNAFNGTATFFIGFPISPGRNGFSPSLGLHYNSGAGNGAFGLGWGVDVPSIRLKTDKGIPKYHGEDTYQLSGVEDLVPFLKETSPGVWEAEESIHDSYTVKRFRPRIEGSFSKLERISCDAHGVYWRLVSGTNITTIFGRSTAARIADPEDETKIFEWLAEFSFDDKGNWIKYGYKEENLENVPDTLFESHRHNGNAKFTNQYLKRVKYGNKKPYYIDETLPFDPVDPTLIEGSPEEEHFFEVVFDYGEHDELIPSTHEEEGLQWNYRPDAFSSYRSGFEIRTFRLCERVLMFHKFDELGETPCLVKSTKLTYKGSDINGAGGSEVSYLVAAEQSGYIRKEDNSYSKKSLPPVELSYQTLEWNKSIQKMTSENLHNAPVGLSANYQWVDLYNEGISGILYDHNGQWYYKENLGDSGEGVEFAAVKQITKKPSLRSSGSGEVSILDLDSNGTKQVAVNTPGISGYYSIGATDSKHLTLENFKPFKRMPNVDWNDQNTRYLDLSGDGLPDIVLTEESAFVWYPSDGSNGYKSAEFAAKSFNEESGPSIVFKDLEECIFLADLTGDGLTDIVRIRNGEICYWANKGYGRFSAKVTMSNAPVFDYPDAYNPEFIHLADISGTGATDIIYLGQNTFKAFINNSGNSWSDAQEIDPFIDVQNQGKLSVIDFLGTGTSCIVWSSGLPGSAPMQYIDLMSSKKPHVLIGSKNNLGSEFAFEYKSSTYFYLKDKREGKPWATKLPFPVQVVSKVLTEDKITASRFTTEYHYSHGYYDSAEREFRGFGRVDQIDTEHFDEWKLNNSENLLELDETLYQAPVLTRTWFHTGAAGSPDALNELYSQEYWFNVIEEEGFLVSVNEHQLPASELLSTPFVDDAEAINNLSSEDWRGATRACKGSALRSEVFALDAPADASEEQLRKRYTPYVVTVSNCTIHLVQPKEENRHAVYFSAKSEQVSYAYDRNHEDPKKSHSITLQRNNVGLVESSVSIVYPRSLVDHSLPESVRDAQAKTSVIYQEFGFTNDINSEAAYRLRLPSESKSFELTDFMPSEAYFTKSDFEAVAASNSIPYELNLELDADPFPGAPKRRLIKHARSYFMKNDLSGSLGLNVLESLALPYENYALVYTPELLAHIFGDKIANPEVTMLEGGYVHTEGDLNWWLPSGKQRCIDEALGESVAEARERFFLPVIFSDPFGNISRVSYYEDHFLHVKTTENALGSTTEVQSMDMRTLTPHRIVDQNATVSEVISDELGMVKAIALLGKDLDEDGTVELNLADELNGISRLDEDERATIDAFFATEDSNEIETHARTLLQGASQRFVYNLNAYTEFGAPVMVSTIVREEHYHEAFDDSQTRIQTSFEYMNGSGRTVMTKTQAEPGEAKQLVVGDDDTISVSLVDTSEMEPTQLRWIGNGRTVFNNKGKPVKQYEPYFSVTPAYEHDEALVETGVTPIIYYDSIGRVVKTLFPDGTFSRIEHHSWKQVTYDQNDTVEESQWYTDRIDRLVDAALLAEGKSPEAEELAAQKSSKHYATPLVVHKGTMSEKVLTIAHNKNEDTTDRFHISVVCSDIEGNVLEITDDRGNTVMQYAYSMTGEPAYQNSMDSGERWTLSNVANQPIVKWDSKDQRLDLEYDVLHRMVQMKVTGPDLNHLFEVREYGEGMPNDKALNARGKVINHYDSAGKQSFVYDQKGNVLQLERTFAMDYKNTVDWNVADRSLLLEAETFVTSNIYDALGRTVSSELPDGTIVKPSYNRRNLLNTVKTDESGIETTIVGEISYNEQGKRLKVTFGNGVFTHYTYDLLNFRLLRIQTQKDNGKLLQDLNYTYDPVGNIMEIEDRCIPTIFFDNYVVEPKTTYTYDATYQLIKAEGREHAGQQIDFGSNDNHTDIPFLKEYNAHDPMSWRNYTQSYVYDGVGNLLEMKHATNDPNRNWIRDYVYAINNNRLEETSVSGNTYTYLHDAHGCIIDMPHLQVMEWNFKDELHAVSTQRVNSGTPEITYFVYDSEGNRVRKVTENQAQEGADPTQKEQRYYLGAYEVFRKNSSGLERRTVRISDEASTVAMIDKRNDVNDGTDPRTLRYQLSNHQNSSALELDENAVVINYEEYHPFGTTSYQAVNKSIKAAAKRYRYTGMERDDESGLSYHTARYYISWLGRWLSSDPIGIKGGLNLYAYVNNNPANLSDPSGLDGRISVDQSTHTITYSTTNHFFGTAAEIQQMQPIAQQAEAFFNNPTIETTAETRARLNGNAPATPRTATYTDSSGQVWTVRFNVTYVFHDTATTPVPADIQTIYTNIRSGNPMTIPSFQSLLQSGTAAIPGFQQGDNVMMMGATGTSVGGITYLVSEPSASAPTFGNPLSRSLVTLGNRPGYLLESMIHETGHTLGLDERYTSLGPLSTSHTGFEYDMMGSGSGQSAASITMHPTHINTFAEYALTVANQNTITNHPIEGIITNTTDGGNIQQFQSGGTVNPAYTAAQQTLNTEVTQGQRVFSWQQLFPQPTYTLPPSNQVPNLTLPPPPPPNQGIPNLNPYVIFRF